MRYPSSRMVEDKLTKDELILNMIETLICTLDPVENQYEIQNLKQWFKEYSDLV